ncbi:MAG: serine/threonine-protein kinase [Burkholderiaceae bacterium]|nr:serine/threonine-protein kinase [Burkholderiaceae bacterium]
MTAMPSNRPRDAAADNDGSFAATVVEELPDTDDPEALPGALPVDDRSLHALPTIGHVGRYTLKYQLGAGGLGTVYAALDPLLSRPIAVKTLHVDAAAAQREALESQLLAEARAAAGLNHPHIVTVYDAGLAEQGVYIAMERLQGRDLRDLLADGWRPEPVQAARIAKRIADALAYAHGHGVIHCDIKPANIYMIGRTQPKLLDFGIARVAQQQGQPDAVAGHAVDIPAGASVPPAELGSPYYVAPEQLRGENLDLRCDVYGVGVVLYELLTGRRAFEGRSLDSIRHAVLEARVPPAHSVNRNVNAALSDIVARAMARNPAQRYRSARQLARALRNWLEDEASQQAAAPLGRTNGAWTAFAGLGLAAAAAFWVVGTGNNDAQPPAEVRHAAPSTANGAPATPVVQPALAAPSVAPVSLSTSADATARPASAALPLKVAKADAAEATRVRERRLAREVAAAAAPVVAAAPVLTQGIVQLAVSPWGQVEVDGVAAGATPPLSRLTLPAGKHQIVVRNDDFPPFTTTVTVAGDKPVTLRYRFGS